MTLCLVFRLLLDSNALFRVAFSSAFPRGSKSPSNGYIKVERPLKTLGETSVPRQHTRKQHENQDRIFALFCFVGTNHVGIFREPRPRRYVTLQKKAKKGCWHKTRFYCCNSFSLFVVAENFLILSSLEVLSQCCVVKVSAAVLMIYEFTSSFLLLVELVISLRSCKLLDVISTVSTPNNATHFFCYT